MKRLINVLIWSACSFCALYFWANLNLTASLLLALMFAAAMDAATTVVAKPKLIPYFVKFNPDVYKMLIALGLATPESWKAAFLGEASTDPWSGDYVCRYGVYAYGLFFDSEGNTIFHWPKLGIYSEGLSASIELNNFPQDDGSGSFSKWNPRLVMRRTMKGNGIGLEVRSSWWDSVGSKLDAVAGLKYDTDYLIGRTVVYFAHFPHQVLWEFSTDSSMMKSIDMKAVLDASGWALPDRSHYSEIGHLHPPEEYTHLYVNVATNYIHHIR